MLRRCHLFVVFAVLLSAVGLVALPAQGAEWPQGAWAPPLALTVPISRFSAQGADVRTVLCRLDNECGLVFGYADIDPGSAPPASVTLSLENCTIGDVVAQLAKATPGFEWSTVDGVVTAVRLGADGKHPPVFDATVAAFDCADLPLHEFRSRLLGALAELKDKPPMYGFEHDVYGAGGVPSVTLHLANVSCLELLTKSAGLLNRSWVLDLDTSRARAVFMMGKRWGALPAGKVEVEVAPGAPKQSSPGQPPSPEVVQERVRAAILDARLRRVQGEEAADELASLIGDRWAGEYATMDVLEAVRLLGDMRAETAIDVLVRNIDLGGTSSVKTLREQMKAAADGTGMWATGANANVPPEMRQEVTYEVWVRSFRAVEALTKIGLPAVPALLDALGATDPNAPPGPSEPTYAQEEREGKVILLCETLQRMLGKEEAVRRLEEAAAAREDAAAAGRLRDAAKRITEGAVLPGLP
jgi:hypothetical protein